MTPEQIFNSYQIYAAKTARAVFRQWGRNSGASEDDAVQEGLLACYKAATTFRASLGQFAGKGCTGYGGVAIVRAVRRFLCGGKKHAAAEYDERLADAEQQPAALLCADSEDGQRRGIVGAARAAQMLGIAERRLRELCELGELPAEKDARGRWTVQRKDLAAHRRKAVLRALPGRSLRAAAAEARVSRETARRAMHRAALVRPRGRRPACDQQRVRDLLSDPAACPRTWRSGRPILKAIAREVGVCPKAVRRELAKLRGDK